MILLGLRQVNELIKVVKGTFGECDCLFSRTKSNTLKRLGEGYRTNCMNGIHVATARTISQRQKKGEVVS